MIALEYIIAIAIGALIGSVLGIVYRRAEHRRELREIGFR